MEITFLIPINEIPKTRVELIEKLKSCFLSCMDEVYFVDKFGDI